jgi:hypothetical protein
LSNVYERYVAAKQATEDQIPVIDFNAAVMGMEIVDWIEREQRLFGKRRVPMPGLKRSCKDDMPRMSPLNGLSHLSA